MTKTKYSNAIAAIIAKTRATSDHSKRMQAVQNRIMAATTALENLAETRDPTMTNQAHILQIAKAAERLQKTLARESAVMDDLRTNAAIDLSAKVDAKANLKPNPQYADHILRRFQILKSSDQAGLIGDLMRMKDGPSLAAILNAPSAASGIAPEMRSRYIETYQKAAAPDEYAEMSEMYETESATGAIISAANRSASELSDPRVVSEILSQQQRSQTASGAFDAATGTTALH